MNTELDTTLQEPSPEELIREAGEAAEESRIRMDAIDRQYRKPLIERLLSKIFPPPAPLSSDLITQNPLTQSK